MFFCFFLQLHILRKRIKRCFEEQSEVHLFQVKEGLIVLRTNTRKQTFDFRGTGKQSLSQGDKGTCTPTYSVGRQ